jgi:hypothetical protein
MKNWKQIAEGSGLDIPDLERIAPALDALEAAFRPLAGAIPHDAEPSLVFRAGDDVTEEPR